MAMAPMPQQQSRCVYKTNIVADQMHRCQLRQMAMLSMKQQQPWFQYNNIRANVLTNENGCGYNAISSAGATMQQ